MTAQLALGFGPWEMWVILLIALLLFGHRIPGMARSLGSGIVEFKRGLKGSSDNSSGAVTSGSTASTTASASSGQPTGQPTGQPAPPSPPSEETSQQDQSQSSSPDQGPAKN